jgi:excisionase family DNA binding protein
MATQEPSAPQVLTAVVAGTAGPSGPARLPSPANEGMRRGSPTQRQGRNRLSQLPTDRQVADLLYVSPKTVSRWAKEGKLPFLKTLGGHRRYPEAEIRELAEELREEAMT